jgi:glycosyltransferase involved in cell wall biosynthesis
MGPVSTDICELANGFAERGHDTILADIRGGEPRPHLHARIRLLELTSVPRGLVGSEPRSTVVGMLRRLHNCNRLMKELTSSLNLSSANVVHFHWPLPAFFALRLYGLGSVCYTAHTPTWSLAGVGRSPIANLMACVERDVIRRSHLSVGLGTYLAVAVPAGNVVTIPNGINLGDWPPLSRAEARQALGIGDNEFVVLFAGRISRVKGVDTLLEAVRLVAPQVPELNVHIVGPLSGSFDARDEHVHSYAQEMLGLARDLPVRFLGFINNREIQFRQHLAAADLFVLPSRSEPQGKVVLEALAMGTPVIGSATGGIPDMVSSDVGYLFIPGDAADLAARIREAHERPQKLREMQNQARPRVQAHYTWDAIADRHLAAFREASMA